MRVTTDELRQMLLRNPGDAVRWTEAAAKMGMAPAQIVWGQLRLDGHGVARDRQEAYSWFKKAAAQGSSEAQNMVGRCYEKGWGVAVDFERARECFEIAAGAGHAWGKVNLAQTLMRLDSNAHGPRCFSIFKTAAEGGTAKVNLKAMNSLARFLEEGWAGPQDLAGAAHWYRKAAALGDHWAQYNLATILFGQGDDEAAGKLVRNAIAISDNGFRQRIAIQLLTRPETALRKLGLEALARCAEGNAADDLYAYGLALYESPADLRDIGEADRVFKAAAAQGHALAGKRLRLQAPLRTFCLRLGTSIRTAIVLLFAYLYRVTINCQEIL